MKTQITRKASIVIGNRRITKKYPCGFIEIKNKGPQARLTIDFRGSDQQRNDVMSVYEFFVRILNFSKSYELKNSRA